MGATPVTTKIHQEKLCFYIYKNMLKDDKNNYFLIKEKHCVFANSNNNTYHKNH